MSYENQKPELDNLNFFILRLVFRKSGVRQMTRTYSLGQCNNEGQLMNFFLWGECHLFY